MNARRWAMKRREQANKSVQHALRFAWTDMRRRKLDEIRRKRGWKLPGRLKYFAKKLKNV